MAVFSFVCLQGHDSLAVDLVEDLSKSGVQSGSTAEDTHHTCHGGDGVHVGEITGGQQEEQQGREPKTTWLARVCFRVPTNMNRVKMPHSSPAFVNMIDYAPFPW